MAWFSTHDPEAHGNEIVDEESSAIHRISWLEDGDVAVRERTVTQESVRFVGMDETGKDLCVTALEASADPVYGRIAAKHLPSGEWQVEATTTTYGAWSEPA